MRCANDSSRVPFLSDLREARREVDKVSDGAGSSVCGLPRATAPPFRSTAGPHRWVPTEAAPLGVSNLNRKGFLETSSQK